MKVLKNKHKKICITKYNESNLKRTLEKYNYNNNE